MRKRVVEFVFLSSFRILISNSTVDEDFSSPTARQITATHCATEYKTSFVMPLDNRDGSIIAKLDSLNSKKLVFGERTRAKKKFCKA